MTKRLLRPLVWILRRLRRIPRPTSAGVGLLVVTLALGAGALTWREPAVLTTFGLALAAVLVSLVLPVFTLRGIRLTRLPIENAHAGDEFTVTALLTGNGARRGRFAVMLRDGISGPYRRPGHALALRIGEEPVAVRYRAAIRDRGRHEIRDYELITRAPFGLFEYRLAGEEATEILVFPRIGTFRHDPLPFSRFSRVMTSTETVHEKGEEEFRNLREYRPGDSPRRIAWKATARYAEVMVKEMEDDLTKKVTIFLESRLKEGAGTRDRIRLERAISFTATLLRELARRRYHVTVFSFGPRPGSVSAGRGGRRMKRVMEALAVLEPTTTGTIVELVRSAPPEALLGALPVVVLPTLEPERLHRALAPLPARRRPVVFRADGAWERSLFGTHGEGIHDLHVRR